MPHQRTRSDAVDTRDCLLICKAGEASSFTDVECVQMRLLHRGEIVEVN